MDDLSDFERRLAAGLDGLVGPRRAVPAAAITQAAMQRAARPSAMRSLLGGRSNSNSRLLYAGVAALLLVAGGIAGFAAAALTNKSEPPAIVAPSASTAPSPTTSTGTWPDKPPFVAYWTGRSSTRTLELWVSRVDGTDSSRVTQRAARLGWSADGRRLAVVTTESERLYFAEVGDRVGPLVDSGVQTGAAHGCPDASGTLNPCQIEQIALAPDGRHVAFSQDCTGGVSGCFNIAVVDLQTGRQTVLDATTTSMFRPLREVAWSPDSSTIAFARQRDSRDRTQASDIYMVDADGTNLRKLDVGGLSVIAPAYSPDGTTIAFTSHYWRSSGGDNLDLEETDVYTVGIDGSGLRRLTTDGHATGPDWTGDGRIRFYRQPFPLGALDENVPSLWLINADGSGETARPAPVIRPGITRLTPYGPLSGLLVQPEP